MDYPSSYYRIRTLHELVIDVSNSHPNALKFILQDFYADEIITGRDNVGKLYNIQKELIKML